MAFFLWVFVCMSWVSNSTAKHFHKNAHTNISPKEKQQRWVLCEMNTQFLKRWLYTEQTLRLDIAYAAYNIHQMLIILSCSGVTLRKASNCLQIRMEWLPLSVFLQTLLFFPRNDLFVQNYKWFYFRIWFEVQEIESISLCLVTIGQNNSTNDVVVPHLVSK